MGLPKYISKFFWDIDSQKANPKNHKKYYISRILDIGDTKAVSWLFKLFGKNEVKKHVRTTKLSPRSANYWYKFFHTL